MPDSRAQVRLARAVVSGKARAAMPEDVAREIIRKMHGRSMKALPERAKKQGGK